MSMRYIDWIWNIRGSLALAPGQSADEAFERLDPLFQQVGTAHERSGDRLTFSKKDQAAQDKMSIFNNGVLQIEEGAAGRVLRYSLTSHMLLFCFLVPLLFLGISQFTVAVGKMQKPPVEKAEKAKKKPEMVMHPLDKALGAPVAVKKSDKEKAKDKAEKFKKKYSPTPAYVFAGIFAFLYVVGRFLEQWLIRSRFRAQLLDS